MSFSMARRQDINTRSRYSSSPKELEVPALSNASSVSSSSTPPSAPGTPSRRFATKTKKNRPPSAVHSSMSSDNSILRGAEILRKQLIEDSFDEEEALMYLHREAPASASYHHQYEEGAAMHPSHSYQEEEQPVERHDALLDDHGSQSSDWSDPWPPPLTEGVSEDGDVNRTRPTTYWDGPAPEQEQQTAFSFPSAGDAKAWAPMWDDEEEGDDGEGTTRTNDDNTTAVLARAGEILERASEVTGTPARVSPDNTPETFMGRNRAIGFKTQTYLVQRTEDIDASTYDESFLGAPPLPEFGKYQPSTSSYLPTGLVDSGNHTTRAPVPHRSQSSASFDADRQDSQQRTDPMDLLKDLQAEEEGLFSEETDVRYREEQQRRLAQAQEEKKSLRTVKRAVRRDPNVALMAIPFTPVKGPSPCDNVVPPSSSAYRKLQRDQGYLHAQRAGAVWQSLVSQHVRFPSRWWNGARCPPLGVGTRRMWNHVGRHRVRGNPALERMVRHRGSPGRLLLHLILRDIMTGEPILDLAIGCFHPNARGVRTSMACDPYLEGSRDIWLATRNRTDDASVIESLLQHRQPCEESPLGAKHDVHNDNMRAVFGESPPQHTVFCLESELYELFSKRLDGGVPAAALVLEEYLPEW